MLSLPGLTELSFPNQLKAMQNTYSVTTVTHQRRAILQTTQNAQLLLDTLIHYRNQGRYRLHGFAIMPEHVHLLITPSSQQTIERCMQCIKGGFSHQLRKHLPAEIWQPHFHSHRIRDLEDFRTQLNYIAENPHRRNLTGHTFVHTHHLNRLDVLAPHQTPEMWDQGISTIRPE
jgi:putative transposase